jgi:tRNA(fMet)-specific endonuclease VapC
VIHLDTNAAIALLNGEGGAIRSAFDSEHEAGKPFAISIVVYHELMYGAANSARRHDNQAKIMLFLISGGIAILRFDEDDAREAADIRAALRRTATPIGPYDVLIAAQARRAAAILVTANGREFKRVPGLAVVDWSEPRTQRAT